MQDTASIQPTYKPQKSNALRRADKHRSDLYKSSILHYCPSLIGQIYLTRLEPLRGRWLLMGAAAAAAGEEAVAPEPPAVTSSPAPSCCALSSAGRRA